MDVKDNLLVIGTADRYINVVNLTKPTEFYKTLQSPLKWQTRVVACFKDAAGFGVGSIEGRCAMQYVEEKDARSVTTPTPVLLPTNEFIASTSHSSVTATHHKGT